MKLAMVATAMPSDVKADMGDDRLRAPALDRVEEIMEVPDTHVAGVEPGLPGLGVIADGRGGDANGPEQARADDAGLEVVPLTVRVADGARVV